MILQLKIPDSFADASEVRVLQWHCPIGEQVKDGQLIVELETDKVIIEVRATCDGFLRKIFHEEGDWASVGSLMALFSDSLEEMVPDELDKASLLPVEFELV